MNKKIKEMPKQDQIIELLGAICEKMDKLLTLTQSIGSTLTVFAPLGITPPPPPPNPYPIAMLYGVNPPSLAPKPWSGTTPMCSGDQK